jgi:hypothetical protein
VNSEVPQLLDYIVAKMLAKPLEERYQDAAEVARDLREAERQLSAPPSDTQALRASSTTLALPQPKLMDAEAKTIVLAQSVARTREADRVTGPEEPAAPPAHGLASSFDSAEATQRLASLTGVSAPQTTTQAMKSIPRPPSGRWRRRDWLVVGGAALCGLIAAGMIVRRR